MERVPTSPSIAAWFGPGEMRREDEDETADSGGL